MSEFVMGARLQLYDSFSQPLHAAISATQGFRSASMSAAQATGSYSNSQATLRSQLNQVTTATHNAVSANESYGASAEGLSSKIFNLKNAVVAFATGAAMKKGFDWLVSGNADMETYKNTLTVVMGSQQKAVEQLEWAQKFAAQTPFEIPQVVEATTRMQAYGISAKDTLGTVGDMASVMGKDLMQAVEAVADAQTGEVERLKEFGITKDMIAAQAKLMGVEAVNAKGQITDQKAFNTALFAIMKQRYSGGMEMQSKSFKGMISNAQDFMGTMGRKLGAPIFEALKTQLGSFLDNLNTLQNNGTIDKWINNVQAAIFGVANVVKVVFPYLVQGAPLILGLAAAFMAYYKTIAIVEAATKAWAFIQKVLNAELVLNPIGLVVASIVALVAALVWAWNTFPQFRAVVMEAFGAISTWVTSNWPIIRDTIIGVWNTIYTTCAPIVQFLWQVIQAAFTAISSWVVTNWPIIQNTIIAVWTYIYNAVAPIVTMIFNTIAGAFNAIMSWVQTYWPMIQTIITFVWQVISTITQVVWAGLSAYIGAYAATIWAVIKGAFDIVVAVVQGAWGMVTAVIEAAWGVISNIVGAALNLLTGNFSAAGQNILNIFTSLGNGIVNFFSSLGGMLYDSGAAIIRTLVSGIESMAMAPVNAIKGIFSKVRELLPFSDAHEGPLSQLTLSGSRIMTTLATGVNSQSDAVKNAVSNAFTGAIPTTQTMGIDASVNPTAVGSITAAQTAGVNPAGTVAAAGGNTTHIDKIVDKIIIEKVDGDDADSLADKVIDKLHEKLSAAADVAGNADMGVLL